MESNKNMFVVLAMVTVAIIGFVVWGVMDSSRAPESGAVVSNVDPNEVIYFYGDTCPHCHDVKDFFDEKGVRDQVTFAEKEVWRNSENAKEMEARAKFCQLDVRKTGVPFLFAEGQCYIGSPDVIGWFEKKIQN